MIITFNNIELQDWQLHVEHNTWYRVDKIININNPYLSCDDNLTCVYATGGIAFFGKLYQYEKHFCSLYNGNYSVDELKVKIDQFLLKYDKIKSFL